MIGVLVIFVFVASVSCRPSYNIVPQNVVTVPPNCPPGQEFINGACRDVWRYNYGIPKNVITVPPNCPSGQEFINGACRDVWIRVVNKEFENMIEPVQDADDDDVEFSNRNVISVPNQCPIGYKPDAHGICREIFKNNI